MALRTVFGRGPVRRVRNFYCSVVPRVPPRFSVVKYLLAEHARSETVKMGTCSWNGADLTQAVTGLHCLQTTTQEAEDQP